MEYAGTIREQMIDYMNRAVVAIQHKETDDSISGYIAEMIAEVRKRVNENGKNCDFAEKAELKKYFSNLEYQRMITAKVDVLEIIGDNLSELPEDTLQEYLKEFVDDPVATLAFFGVTRGRSLETFKTLFALKKENQEKRQERLKKAFSQFENIMLRVGERVNLEIEASAVEFTNWLRYQTDKWERTDAEIRDEMQCAGEEHE